MGNRCRFMLSGVLLALLCWGGGYGAVLADNDTSRHGRARSLRV